MLHCHRQIEGSQGKTAARKTSRRPFFDDWASRLVMKKPAIMMWLYEPGARRDGHGDNN
jgi:hypothetical protein